jgi:hypothetical protein
VKIENVRGRCTRKSFSILFVRSCVIHENMILRLYDCKIFALFRFHR